MKKLFPYIIPVLLVISILLNLRQCDSASDEYSNRMRDQKTYTQRQLAQANELKLRDSVILRIQEDRKKEVEEYVKKQSAANSLLKSLKRRERLSRTDTVLISLTDTVFATYDTILARCESQLISQKNSFQAEIDTLESKIVIWERKFVSADSVAQIHFQEKTPSSWGVGGSAGYGATLSNGQIHAGPSAVFGISYRIPMKKISLRKFLKRR